MAGQPYKEPDAGALCEILAQSQAVTDSSDVSTPPTSGIVDRQGPSRAIPTPARSSARQALDSARPDLRQCEGLVADARCSETRSELMPFDYTGCVAPSPFRHHLQASYPPGLPKDPSWRTQQERASLTGINARALVDENRRQVRAYLRYARDEQESRQSLFDKLDKVEETLLSVRQEIQSLGPNRRKDKVPTAVLDMISALQLREGALNQERQELLNLLWLRRAEVEGIITGILENKPMEFKSKEIQPTVVAGPPCAPNIPDIDGTQNRGVGDGSQSGMPDQSSARFIRSGASQVNIFGLDMQARDPDLRAAYERAYSQGIGGLAEAQRLPKEPPRPRKSVPDWFSVLDEKGVITLGSQGEENRFVELTNKIWRLEEEIRRNKYKRKEHEQAGGKGAPKAPWDDHFHGPNPGWVHQVHRLRGGWWKCRSGEDAPQAERLCQLCHSDSPESSRASSPVPPIPWRMTRKSPPPADFLLQQEKKQRQRHDSTATSAEYLEELMGHIRAAMAAVAEKDKKYVTAVMQLERLDVNRQLHGDV